MSGHPVLDAKTIHAQKQMHKIQGKRGISYVGAYLRYGFHEDGFTLGLVAAAALAARGGSGSGSEEATKESVRPPFRIERAEKEANRTVWMVVLATLFDLVEALGVRWLMGLVESAVLGGVRWAAGVHVTAV